MGIRLVMVGRTERGFVLEGLSHYMERLRRMVAVEETIVPEATSGGEAYRRTAEGERILGALRPGEVVVVLDERGKQLASAAFAERLGKWRDGGARKVAFVIGGPYGMNDAVRERADLVLALSAMTLPHQLVRVVLAEQVYRAFGILRGSPYHH